MKNDIIKIGILGAGGRMGQALIRCISRFPKLSLAGALESADFPELGRDAGLVAGIGRTGVTISSDQKEIAGPADVFIDFSSPRAAAQHADIAADNGKGMVIGVTGLTADQAKSVKKAASAIPVVWAPNMSMGVNLLFDLVERAAKILHDYDIEIVEAHHKHKKDAPSGTALRLLEAAAAARNTEPDTVVEHGRHGQTDGRPDGQIGLHAIRAGDIVGEHTVILASEGERMELTHRASSRDCFAMGALRAAEWVAGRAPGLYNMQHVLNPESTG